MKNIVQVCNESDVFERDFIYDLIMTCNLILKSKIIFIVCGYECSAFTDVTQIELPRKVGVIVSWTKKR